MPLVALRNLSLFLYHKPPITAQEFSIGHCPRKELQCNLLLQDRVQFLFGEPLDLEPSKIIFRLMEFDQFERDEIRQGLFSTLEGGQEIIECDVWRFLLKRSVVEASS